MDKWLYSMIKLVLAAASPEIVNGIRVAVADMAARAKRSSNPWDDSLAGFLQMIVGKPDASVPPKELR